MKRIYVNEKWCLACHLCEYECAFAATGMRDMAQALKGKTIHPKITVEEGERHQFCRELPPLHGRDLRQELHFGRALQGRRGHVQIDQEKCVGCLTCVLVCPFGAIRPAPDGHVAQKCMLCTDNACGYPNCVKYCPNNAIVYEERE